MEEKKGGSVSRIKKGEPIVFGNGIIWPERNE